MTDAHRTVGKRFVEADLAEDRFVSVKDGQKMCVDHDTRWSDPENVSGVNYGIYADEDDQLFVLDVDVHRDDEDAPVVAIAALSGLEEGLKVRSPHADKDTAGGHEIYKLAGDRAPAELFSDVFGRANPVPSWGEVVAKNKYVVGPGSQLDGCDKDWCDECDTTTGGQYVVEVDKSIPTVEPETIVEALNADPDLTREDQEQTESGSSDGVTSADGDGNRSSQRDYPDLTRDQVEALLDEIPGDQHFDDWIRTGYAVLAWDDGDEGQEVFEDWSKENEKWDKDESQRQIDYIWSSGDPDPDGRQGAGVGTLVHLAREHGDTSDILPESYEPNTKTPAELVAEYSDEYDDAENVPNDLTELVERASGSDENAKPSEPVETPQDWSDVRTMYNLADADEASKPAARLAAVEVLEEETSWIYVRQSERLWVYDEDTGQFAGIGEGYLAARLESELPSHKTKQEKNEIEDRICDRNQVDRTELNARTYDDPLVCVGNCVVNLRTGEKLEHGPQYRFTRGLKWDYKPEEKSVDRQGVLDFLDSVTSRTEDRDTLLDHLGHGLMPGHPYRAFVVCYGPGGNGKTQVAELFRAFVGGENAAAVEIDELAHDNFSTSDLPDTFINWGDDMSGDGGGTLQDLSTLKKATGGSEIRCNEKFEKTFNFKNEAAMFFSANEPPRIGEQKRSIEDRIYPIRMPYEFVADPEAPHEKQKVPNISKQLREDEAVMRGLLSLAVKHAKTLIDNNGQYSQPESPEERLEKYNKQADPLQRFTGKAFESADGEHLIRKDDAYTVYTAVMDSWDERKTGERAFKRQLPRTLSEDIETGQSRALANEDDKDRVWCWKRLKWTEEIKDWLPEWMLDRYADHFEETSVVETDEEQVTEEAPKPLAARKPQYGATMTATVETVNDGEYSREAQGRLSGPEGTYIAFVVPGGSGRTLESHQGETVHLEDVTLRTDDDGLLEAVIDDAVTIAAAGEDQSTLDDDDDDGPTVSNDDGDNTPASAATDGGHEGDRQGLRADAQQLVEKLRGLSKDEFSRPEAIAQASNLKGIDSPDRAEAVIEKAVNELGALARIDGEGGVKVL